MPTSAFVYDNAVLPRRRRIDPAAFHRVELDVKGGGIGRITAWLHLPGVPDPGPRFWGGRWRTAIRDAAGRR